MVPDSRARPAALPLLGAAAFAASEGAAGLIGGFFALGRAETLLFLVFRPWLLLLAAVLVSGWSWRRRWLFYLLALLLAGLSESLFVQALGARQPWPEMLRGLAGGVAVALVADVAIQAGRRWRVRLGTLAAAAALAALLASGVALRPYEALVLGDTAPREASARPPLALMTSLPIVWGSGGAFDPESRPASSYRLLQREFDVRLLDAIEPGALRGIRLMLLAQPRMLAPEELVALDEWVRSGGRILILTDPQLAWPSPFPPGDARRPTESGLLAPLLDHWGLRLEGAAWSVEDYFASGEVARRLRMLGTGRFAIHGPGCRGGDRPYLAHCRFGRGAALLVADADLLADELWIGPGPHGGERHLRSADNALLVADWLDRLANVSRERADPEVAWMAPSAGRGRAVLLGALPIALVFASGLGLLLVARER